MMSFFPGRLAVQQRVLPAYRASFFETLAKSCEGGLSLFAGQPLSIESISTTGRLRVGEAVLGRNLHFRDPSSRMYFCWQRGLLDWLGAVEPDALIVEANPRYLSTRRVVRWMHARDKPVLGWGLGVPRAGEERSSLLGLLEGTLRSSFLRSLDGIIAYSQRGAAEYRTTGYPADRVFVATNAATPKPKIPPPQRSSSFGDRPQVLFVGRLQARKRVDLLLQACAALPEVIQPRLVVVGDGPARVDFESVAQSVYPRAEFPGAKHGADLEPYFRAADLFVLPGTGGLAVQQAMTYGLPVIVARGDGTQDDLVRPENGWQVPPGSLSALTEVLRTALMDPPRLRRMGAESYRIVAEEINLDTMVAAFVNALQQVAGPQIISQGAKSL